MLTVNNYNFIKYSRFLIKITLCYNLRYYLEIVMTIAIHLFTSYTFNFYWFFDNKLTLKIQFKKLNDRFILIGNISSNQTTKSGILHLYTILRIKTKSLAFAHF